MVLGFALRFLRVDCCCTCGVYYCTIGTLRFDFGLGCCFDLVGLWVWVRCGAGCFDL